MCIRDRRTKRDRVSNFHNPKPIKMYLPVASWRNKEEATVYSSIGNDLLSVDANLFIEVLVKLFVDVLHNRRPTTEHTLS